MLVWPVIGFLTRTSRSDPSNRDCFVDPDAADLEDARPDFESEEVADPLRALRAPAGPLHW